jgi:nicotinate-nucleotide adenylyltransferase
VSTGERAGVGILGGTFNPPHVGHLAAARTTLEQLGLERVVLMPANVAPHKRREADPGPEHRLAMCRLAVAGQPGLGVCEVELARGGMSYTVDTLRAISASLPNAELTLIVGADTARTLPAWREPRALLELADLAVIARGCAAEREVRERIAPLLVQDAAGGAEDVRPRVSFLEMAPVDVSSSRARERAAAGGPLEDLVGSDVADYIREHGLYRKRELDRERGPSS